MGKQVRMSTKLRLLNIWLHTMQVLQRTLESHTEMMLFCDRNQTLRNRRVDSRQTLFFKVKLTKIPVHMYL